MAAVVLLRGVNVGGHRTFRPSVLVKALEHLRAVNIGAAGTFVVPRAVGLSAVRAEFARRLTFDTEIVVCRSHEITRLLRQDFFEGRPARSDTVRFVSVLSRSPRSTLALPLWLPSENKWLLRIVARDGRFLIGEYRRQMKAIGYLSMLDRLFDVPVTTRNWNTIVAIGKAIDMTWQLRSSTR